MILKRNYTRPESCQRISIFLVIILLFNVSERICAQDFWERIYIPDSIANHSILVDNNDSLYIGVLSNYNYHLQGVYKSSDHGLTWNFKGPQDRSISGLAEDKDGNLFAGSNRFIFKSTDNGESWNLMTYTCINNVSNFLLLGIDTIFASGWDGIIRSLDGGISWDTSLYFQSASSFCEIIKNSENLLFTAAIDFWNDSCGIFRSDDWGETWIKVMPLDITSIAINSNDEIFATTLYNGIYKSSNSGENWTKICDDIVDILTIVINSEDIIFVGCQGSYQGGVYVSYNNGSDWYERTTGLASDRINKLYIDHAGFLYALNNSRYPYGTLHKSINTTVGINNKLIDHINAPGIYPNPTTTNLSIDCSMFHDNESRIDIFDLFGQNVKEIKVPKGNSKVELDVEGWQRGLYLVRVVSEEGSRESAKVLIR